MPESPPECPDTPSCFCRRCSRNLKKPSSIKHGYGNVCYRKRMSGDTRTARQMDPCTITDPDLASKVFQAIYRIIRGGPGIPVQCAPADIAHGLFLTGQDIKTLPLESFDHDGGMIMPGFGKPQMFCLHTEKYDLAISKIRIKDNEILDEMKRVGDIPQDWKPIEAKT